MNLLPSADLAGDERVAWELPMFIQSVHLEMHSVLSESRKPEKRHSSGIKIATLLWLVFFIFHSDFSLQA